MTMTDTCTSPYCENGRIGLDTCPVCHPATLPDSALTSAERAENRRAEVLAAIAADPELLFAEVDFDFAAAIDPTLRDGGEPLTAAAIIRRLLELAEVAR